MPDERKRKPNDNRIYVCEECFCTFSDEEIKADAEIDLWGHKCGHKKDARCESYLKAYVRESPSKEGE